MFRLDYRKFSFPGERNFSVGLLEIFVPPGNEVSRVGFRKFSFPREQNFLAGHWKVSFPRERNFSVEC